MRWSVPCGGPPLRADGWFRRLRLVSAGLYSLGHGGNDAQKTIGIIWMLLIASGHAVASDPLPPSRVIWSRCSAIAIPAYAAVAAVGHGWSLLPFEWPSGRRQRRPEPSCSSVYSK